MADNFIHNQEPEESENLDEFEEVSNLITLQDDNGNEMQFEFLDLIEYEQEDYVVLLPVLDCEDEDGGRVLILRVVEYGSGQENEEERYEEVLEEEVLNAVYRIFKEKFKEEFNFTDNL